MAEIRLKEKQTQEVVPRMMEMMGYQNVMQVPRLEKVVLNIGVGEAIANARTLEAAQRDLATIAGQRPVITRARRSIAAFKIREGNPIGVSVTLRGNRMLHFLDRLMNVVLPRIRDFQGVPAKSFDGRGNYALGMREQIVFPEIEYDKVDKVRGLEVIIVTTATNDEEGRQLLQLLGMPFQGS
ncbi:MAG: 50S ribosomal protein L5 [Dehalococcoidia bacterium]|jgi:large subunit ribosomal protein L5|nr:50S ribosomal protein L5 [Dehalococcoidia bacterium]MDP6783191.1 50S ribosomal protein L5 [Dehalococcoidia bacterium]